MDGIKKLDTSGEKANELEDTATETNLEDRGKQRQKTKQSTKSACCETVASGLTHNSQSQRERNEGQRQKN